MISPIVNLSTMSPDGLKRQNLMVMLKCVSSLLETSVIWKSSIFASYIFSRKVSYEEGAKFAKDNDLIFMEVSAKTAYQVEDAFKKNAELLLDKI